MLGSQILADGINLQTVSVVAAGAGASINTTGFNSIAIAATGMVDSTILLQGSNDNSSWVPLPLVAVDSLDIVDGISSAGIFSLKVSTLYVQFNVTQFGGAFGISLLGRQNAGPNAADKLSLAMNPETNFPLNVNVMSGIKVDSQRAILPSDAPAAILISIATGGQNYVLDTAGYSSLSVTSQTLQATLQASNDLTNWATLNAVFQPSAASVQPLSLSPTVSIVIPCCARYLRFVAITPGTATAFFRTAQAPYSLHNLYWINGTQIASAGVAGVLPIGGNAAPGAAATINPVSMGGVSPDGLTRRLLCDTLGRMQSANASPVQTPSNVTPVNVQDSTLSEGGFTIAEILLQILMELRLANQQRYEFNFNHASVSDEPETYRNDQTLFRS